jgi:sulfate permease, SulP family
MLRAVTQAMAKGDEAIFAPKLFSVLKEYSWKLFWGDLSAGALVGVVALPLAIAFGIASGTTPERGLATAIVAGFLISLLGGSRVQIGGPTGAFVVIVYGIIQKHGLDGLAICTLLAGVILILMGVFRLGAIIRFIPYPLIVGFTSGIAVVIFSSQIADFFGLKTGPVPAEFVEKWELFFHSAHTADGTTALLALGSLALLMIWPRLSRKIPGSIVVIVLATAVVEFFDLPVATIGSRFPDLPTGLPAPAFPVFSFQDARALIGPAFVVALLGAIESLLSATVADGMVEGRHRSNTELIAQGIANLACPLFGGIPATGALARTATNVKNGAKTPVAGIVHAVTLLLIVLFFGRWVQLIPLCVLSAILFIVAYHMSEWFAFKNLLRAPRMDVAVLLVTFFLTVLVDLTVAVEIGMILAMISLVKRMTEVTAIRPVTRRKTDLTPSTSPLEEAEDAKLRESIPTGVEIYEAEGVFFFGVASKIRDMLRIGKEPPKALILRMAHVLALDASAIRALEELHKSCQRAKTQLILEGLASQPLTAIKRSGFLAHLGADNVAKELDAALERAKKLGT